MIVKGDRRGGPKQLADHLLRTDTNEEVILREFHGYPSQQLDEKSLRGALQLMETQARLKGKARNLYHAIIALPEGEILDVQQLKKAVDSLAQGLGLTDHQRIIVEHRKASRQHFHVVFNIIDPHTGKAVKLGLTRRKEWKVARELESLFGLKPVQPKGRSVRRWEYERGKRSGINPLSVREEVTSIYHASKNAAEFVAKLAKAGYVLTKGRYDAHVLVDKAGDIHGLLRRIEGIKRLQFQEKFPDLKHMSLPLLEAAQQQRRLAVKAVHKTKLLKPSLPISSGLPVLGPVALRKPMHGDARLVSRRALLLPHPSAAALRAWASCEKEKALRTASLPLIRRKKRNKNQNEPVRLNPARAEIERAELLAWAWENHRADILAQFGIHLPSLDE